MADEAPDRGGKRAQRFGRFEIRALVASGGMGAVYKAYDPKEKITVALKVMAPELAAKPNMIKRFQREAQSAAKLRHENIVAIKEFGALDDTFYLALEYIEGKDLHDHIARSPGGRLTPEEARVIALQAARALEHAHQAGVIHRDVKPSNFLVVTFEGMPLVKLTDFGLARHENDDEHRVTKAGMTLGTVDYMAPEQARDSSKADVRSDMYSLGCTLFHMLAGRPPFNKGTMAEKLVQHLESEPPEITHLNDAVPAGLAAIQRRLIAKKPRDRYQTPTELIADLLNPERALWPKTEPELERDDKKPRKPATQAAAPAVLRAKSSEAPSPRKSKKRKALNWMPLAIGGGALALVAIIGLFVLRSLQRTPEPKKPDDGRQVQQPVQPIVAPAPMKQLTGPSPVPLKPLYQPLLPLDIQGTAKEMYGPFGSFPEPPSGTPVIVVSRLPLSGISSAPSLKEACAQAAAGAATVIEIRDRGPHFLTAAPALADRSLWLRGSSGIRPLLAWDGSSGDALLKLQKGNLTLENLDVVVLPPKRAEQTCLFQVHGGEIQARDCTFSCAGTWPRGVLVSRLAGPAPTATGIATAKVRFTRCLARGHNMTLVQTDATPADVLVEHSLAVGSDQPLIQHRNAEGDGLTVRIIRSTLVAQQVLWRWQPVAGKGGAPRLNALTWDTVFARMESVAAAGSLLHLADGGRVTLMTFKPVNCLYAGWKHLLEAGDKTCSTLEEWRAQWGHREADLAQPDPWPARSPNELADISALAFSENETLAAYSATGGSRAIGCDLGGLPPEPPLWTQRTFERYVPPALGVVESEPTDIPTEPAGMYHGEEIELGKTDVGLRVQASLQTQKPGPRVVLRLKGSGTHVITPLRFKGIDQVVIHFEQPAKGGKGKVEPLTLEPKRASGAAALIDVEGGSLEIHRGVFRFDNSRTADVPPYLLRVRAGNLRLQGCTLLGPLSKVPDSFQSLISCEGAGFGAVHPVSVTLRDCTLQSAKSLVELKHAGARLHVRGCLLYALDDVLTLDLTTLTSARPDIVAQLENNTVALRQAFVRVRSFDAPAMCEPVVLQAQRNYFLDPFAGETRQSCLVKASGESVARGLILWQGEGNVFARDRWHAYYRAQEGALGQQIFEDWVRFVGPGGELKARFEDSLLGKTFNADQPAYDRLLLPPGLRSEQAPGADLDKLGLIKKK